MSAARFALAAVVLALAGCRSAQAPIELAQHVDLNRFMGDWYVIANIPTFLETDAYNAIESYRLDTDGTIATTFTFNKGAANGPQKLYRPRGFVIDRESNAIWGMRFVWPIKSDYRIVHVDENYSQTIIGREARDYVWIMARTPTVPAADYQRLIKRVQDAGYDVEMIHKVPQTTEVSRDASAR